MSQGHSQVAVALALASRVAAGAVAVEIEVGYLHKNPPLPQRFLVGVSRTLCCVRVDLLVHL